MLQYCSRAPACLYSCRVTFIAAMNFTNTLDQMATALLDGTQGKGSPWKQHGGNLRSSQGNIPTDCNFPEAIGLCHFALCMGVKLAVCELCDSV